MNRCHTCRFFAPADQDNPRPARPLHGSCRIRSTPGAAFPFRRVDDWCAEHRQTAFEEETRKVKETRKHYAQHWTPPGVTPQDGDGDAD